MKSVIYDFEQVKFVSAVDDDKVVRYYEEVVRLMNEMLSELRNVRMELQQNNKTINELNERVRKIGINTSNL